MDYKISEELQQKLDNINWESLNEKYGINKDYVYSNPSIASQLAYGQPTDLIPARNNEFSGLVSLRAYPVQFTPEQAKGLAEGHAVRLDGCRNKEGQTFSCYVQFDAAQRQVVACHPAWLKEAQKTGTDLGLGQQKGQEKTPLKQEKAANKKAVKR